MLGLWLALAPTASTLADPYIKAMNAMPRVILAPIFAVWFGLGITSKVVFGVTLVFFIVFFNVYQGVKEVSPVVLANARMLGASGRQLLRHVYLPSATSWVFSSLHTSVGLAFVGAVVGEYLGSARGVGYLIHQAEGVFDIDTVFAGILVLTMFALILDFVVTQDREQAAGVATGDCGDGGVVGIARPVVRFAGSHAVVKARHLGLTRHRLCAILVVRSRGGAVWQLVGLITRRSQVQILSPQPTNQRLAAMRAVLFSYRGNNPKVDVGEPGRLPSSGQDPSFLRQRTEGNRASARLLRSGTRSPVGR